MFLAIKEMKKEKGKFLMIVLVTVLITYLVYFLTGLAFGLASANKTSIDHWKGNYVILSKPSNSNIYASSIDESVVNKVTDQSISPLNITNTVVTTNTSKKQFNLVLMGIENNDPNILPQIITGQKLKKDNQIVLSNSFKKDTNIDLNDKITISDTNRTYTIVGFTDESEYNTQPVGYVNLNQASQVMQTYKTKDSMDAITSPTPNMPNRLSGFITKSALPKTFLKDNDLIQLSRNEFIDKIPGYKPQILTFSLMIISLIVISAVIIGIFMYILTLQKKSVFAILKIQGISNRFISSSVIYQTFIISLLGIIVGLLLFFITMKFLPNTVPIMFNSVLTLIISVIFILCSLIGSFFSAINALKIDPLDAL